MEKIDQLPNEKIVENGRSAFGTGRTKLLSFRLQNLKALLQMLEENADEMLIALKKDLRKARNEAMLYEVDLSKSELKMMIKNLKEYAEKEHLPLNLLACLDRGYIMREPFGLVLILGPWNYPFLLCLKPLIGAIAAGNVVILKPSECAPASAEFLFKKLPKYLDPDCYQVVLGDVERTKDLLKNKFDYIFCTGSTAVGRSVLMDAAPHLTPCTLELGGKSPCYIDESADFYLASKRVLWGKYVNLGQTCIAPDYILCSKSAEKEFIHTASQVINEWYGEKWQENPDMPRIVNKRNFQRLKNMLDTTKGKIAFGGRTDENDLWIEPTIVVDVQPNDPLMKEEIFGPILPILTVNSVDEAIQIILQKPKPLALYMFSKNEKICDKLISNISSGGVCVNDCVWQNAWQGLPFGGVGESGMGNYHGKYSFDTFSHKKSVLIRGFGWMSEKLGEARYPPYTEGKLNIFRFIVNYFPMFNVSNNGFFSHLMAAVAGGLIVFLCMFLIKYK